MTPDEFKTIRKNLTLTEDGASKYGVPPSSKVSQTVLSRILGVKNDRTLRKWEEGENDIAGPATIVMEAIKQVPEFCDFLGVVFHAQKK